MNTRNLVKAGEMFPTVFEDFFKPWNEMFENRGLWGKMLTMPAVNIMENKDDYTISLAAPGLKKEDFKIDLEGNMLTISCEKEERKEDKGHTRKEYNYTSFRRTFTMPEDVVPDKIEATYVDGELKLKLPLREEAKKPVLTKHVTVK
jgi:HSP20 family protein